jgi:hypothetical protein
MLIARVFEVFPLTCPHCGAEMQIIAFVTEMPSVQAIPDSLGEPARPPPVSPARGPPAWQDDPVDAIPDSDPLVPLPKHLLNSPSGAAVMPIIAAMRLNFLSFIRSHYGRLANPEPIDYGLAWWSGSYADDTTAGFVLDNLSVRI